jgi:hypothetical protein
MITSLGILKWVGDDDFWKSFVLIGDTWLFEEIKWDLARKWWGSGPIVFGMTQSYERERYEWKCLLLE